MKLWRLFLSIPRMKKDELWEQLLKRYPDFKDEEHIVKQTARGLRRLVETAWDEGHAEGVKNGKAIEAMRLDEALKNNPLSGFFR